MKKEGEGVVKQKWLQDEAGFTLVEIIAVLVILGILAAVAIPKYFDLQSEARTKALSGAMGEAVGRLNQKFGLALLRGSIASEISYTTADLGADLGDFTLASSGPGVPAGGSGDILLTITGKAGTPLASLVMTRRIPRPTPP